MYVRLVTFALAGLPADAYRKHATAVADGFTAWPGLLGKVWLADAQHNRYGGVYLFASKADADRSRTTPLFAGLVGNTAFADLMIEEYDTLAEPTAITWAPVAAAAVS